jgi:pimeloyl-ACP methyl ester carboxylesterase
LKASVPKYHQSISSKLPGKAGYTRNGLPYNRAGKGPRPLIIFPGLSFENKPQFGTLFLYSFLEKYYTLFCVQRKPGLPQNYTMKDMSDDYAVMIREEFGQAVDLIGLSTGGSIALHFAAEHPELVRRLVIHSSAHSLGDAAKKLQLEVASLAEEGQWRQAWARLVATIYPQSGIGKWLSQPLVVLSSWLLSLRPPRDPGDLVVTVAAEDSHAFKDRLVEIAAPVLVAAGTDDFFYTASLFRETAAGLPDARLCLYPQMGHPAGGRQFRGDVLAFLQSD